MDSFISPPFLQKGDTVAVVAMASKLNIADIQAAIELIQQQWGLEVIIGESVTSGYYGFAGTDEVRAKDFQLMLDNPSVKGIFSARGGYGSSRIIDQIDFSEFKKNPKWIIGFSDITVVHCHLQNLGFQSLHAPMPKTFMRDQTSLQSLENFIFGNGIAYKVPANQMNREGRGVGQMLGGNLCMLAHLTGSVSEVDMDGKILFIEDVSEYLYNIDRMMIQLKRADKLANLAGLIVGTFSDVKEDSEPFGKTAYKIIAEHTATYNYPVCYGFPVGHDAENWAIPCGKLAVLDISSEEVSLKFDVSLT